MAGAGKNAANSRAEENVRRLAERGHLLAGTDAPKGEVFEGKPATRAGIYKCQVRH